MRRLSSVLLLLTSVAIAQKNAIPFISQLYPMSTHPGHAAFTLDVSGAQFTPTSVVNWNGSARPTTFINPDHLQAAISAADVAVAATASVTVSSPGEGASTSNVIYFPVGPRSTTIAFARHDIPLAGPPTSLVVGDFNNDGKPDVIVADGGGAETFLGNGDGTFRPPISNDGANAILSTGDFNGDGKLDLIETENADPFGAFFLRGNGDGTFTTMQTIGFVFPFLAVGDFNGDGKMDFVGVGSDEVGVFQVYLGNGDFTFNLAQSVDSGSGYAGVSLGDFNRDGKLDAAVTEYAGIGMNVLLYEGKAAGTFQSSGQTPSCGNGCYGSAVVDLNGDYKLDVISDGVDVFLGRGNGSFAAGGFSPVNGLGVVAADLNNDNKADVVAFQVGNRVPSHIVALLGHGDGTFQAPLIWSSGPEGEFFQLLPDDIGIADFDGNGRLDVVSANVDLISGTGVLSVFLQTTLNLSTTYVNFGNIKVGTTSVPQTITLTNIGETDVLIRSFHASGDTGVFHGTSNCRNILPGSSCTLTGVFQPGSLGNFSATIQVGYDGAVGSPQSIEIIGTGD